jgi:hypothetical protein
MYKLYVCHLNNYTPKHSFHDMTYCDSLKVSHVGMWTKVLYLVTFNYDYVTKVHCNFLFLIMIMITRLEWNMTTT